MYKNTKISKMLQEEYGSNRIIIGKGDGNIYFDIPDNPEVFAELIKKMLMALALRNMDDHIHELAEAIEELVPSDNEVN